MTFMKGLPGRIAGLTGAARASASAVPPAQPPSGAQGPEDDPSRTIASALRGLRFRNMAVIGALSVLCIAFVVGGHIANQRFADATSMAVLVARANEVTDRIARTAADMATNPAAATNWTETALNVHAERLADTITQMQDLSDRLDDELRARLIVQTPYGLREPVALLEEFRADVAAAAAGAPDKRVASGKYLDGMIDFLVGPALAQQAETLRDFNREMAGSVRVAINTIGALLLLFAAALVFSIFAPMERSIRTALTKLNVALESAKSAERAKSEFLANMSHEI